jgi:hypothetical protein
VRYTSQRRRAPEPDQLQFLQASGGERNPLSVGREPRVDGIGDTENRRGVEAIALAEPETTALIAGTDIHEARPIG